MTGSARGRIGGGGRRPTVRTGIVSSAGTQNTVEHTSSTTPHDHFAARPHPSVKNSLSGCVGGAGGDPSIRAGIVSPAGVHTESVVNSTPHDHFIAHPHRREKI